MPGGPLCFAKFGVGSLVLSGVMLAVSAGLTLSRVTDFTWFGHGADGDCGFTAFFAMTMFGAAYHILPRVAGIEFPFGKLVRVHFWLGVLGTLFLALPLAVGGVMQGLKLSDPSVPFADVMKSTLLFLRDQHDRRHAARWWATRCSS